MALTVEELQIVLSCDASTAQSVLEKMDATVKAYTEKFQKYFNSMGGGKGGVANNIVSQFETAAEGIKKQTKAITKQTNDWKAQYEKTFGETFEQSMSKAYKNTGEYISSGKKYIESASWDNYERGQRSNSAVDLGFGGSSGALGDIRAKLAAFGADARQAFSSAKAEAVGFGRALQEQIAPTRLGQALSSIGSKIGPALKTAASSAGTIFQHIGMMAQYAGQKIGSALSSGAKAGSVAFSFVRKSLVGVATAVSNVRSSIKKAFQATVLGRFLKQLGRTMMRMAAMRLIRGTLDSIKQGLELLGKASGSAGKAMNIIKTAGQSVKAALGVALMPVVKALAPLFYQLAQAVTTAGNVIARFFATLTGQSSYTAATITGDMDSVSSSVGGAGKAAQGALADFDELHVLSKNSGGGGGGGGADAGFSSLTEKVLGSGNSFAERLREAFLGGNWEQLGTELGNAINSVFSPDRFRSIGENIGEKINALFTTTYWTLNTTNFQNIGASVAELLNGAFSKIDFTKLGGIIVDKFLALPRMIVGFINTMDWGLVGTALGDTLKGAIQAASAFIQEIDWGELVINIITGILDFLAGLDVLGIAADILKFAGSVIGAVVEGLGTILLDICDLLIDPNTWKLVGAWLQDLPKTLLSYGIKMANSITEPIIDGINGLIEKYNGSGLAKILGTIEPINFKLIPEIPEEELHTHYKKAKEEIEADSKKNPTVFDSTANYTNWSVKGTKNASTVSGWTTWDSTANYNKWKVNGSNSSSALNSWTTWNSTANYTGWKVHGSTAGSAVSNWTTWNSTANWNSQSIGNRWAGTTWNSTAQWNSQSIGPNWAGTTWNSTAAFNARTSDISTTWNSTAAFKAYTVDSTLKSKGYMKIEATADIKKVTGNSVNLTQAASGGLFKNGSWHPITSFARGGSPWGGQIFRARENGNPELVGTIRGSTAVMNNGQIVASVSAGVARAIAGIHFKMTGFNLPSIASAIAAPPVGYASANLDPESRNALSNIQKTLASSNDPKDMMTREQATTIISLLRSIERKELTVSPSIGLGQVIQRSVGAYALT